MTELRIDVPKGTTSVVLTLPVDGTTPPPPTATGKNIIGCDWTHAP